MFRSSLMGLVGAPWLLCPLVCPQSSWGTFLLSGPAEWFMLIFGLLCPRPALSHFPRKPFSGEWYLETKIWA